MATAFGLILEVVGYIGRLQLHDDPFNFNFFVEYVKIIFRKTFVDPTKETFHFLNGVRLCLSGPAGRWRRHNFHVKWGISRGKGYEADRCGYYDRWFVIPGRVALLVHTIRCSLRVEMACCDCTPLLPSTAICAYESSVEKCGLW